MMWATSALPRNGRLPAVGGGREAMANDAHGVDVRKNHEAPVPKKSEKKRSDVELRQVGLHTGLYVLWLRYLFIGETSFRYWDYSCL